LLERVFAWLLRIFLVVAIAISLASIVGKIVAVAIIVVAIAAAVLSIGSEDNG
jgi:hypothetical protein